MIGVDEIDPEHASELGTNHGFAHSHGPDHDDGTLGHELRRPSRILALRHQ
ncbi:hypothetical protein [Arthrobacter psychrolactophilus]